MSDKLDYESLNERLNAVNNSIVKNQVYYEENVKSLEAIQKKAMEEYGVSTIEELRELAREMKRKETEGLTEANDKIEKAEIIIKEINDELEALKR